MKTYRLHVALGHPTRKRLLETIAFSVAIEDPRNWRDTPIHDANLPGGIALPLDANGSYHACVAAEAPKTTKRRLAAICL